MATACIDGMVLRTAMAQRNISQKDLAKAVGVTHYNVNRWCKDGIHRIRLENAKAISACLGIPMDSFSGNHEEIHGLTKPEAEWLQLYRSLTPLEQAKIRIELEEILNGKPANDDHRS